MGTLEDRFNSTDPFYYQFNGGGGEGASGSSELCDSKMLLGVFNPPSTT